MRHSPGRCLRRAQEWLNWPSGVFPLKPFSARPADKRVREGATHFRCAGPALLLPFFAEAVVLVMSRKAPLVFYASTGAPAPLSTRAPDLP